MFKQVFLGSIINSSRYTKRLVVHRLVSYCAAALLLVTGAFAFSDTTPQPISFTILEQQSHPSEFFTQGLLVDGPWIYESSGGYGRSLLARYQAKDSSHLVTKQLPKDIFAEGLALLDDKFYLLTWKKGQLYQFDRDWQLQKIQKYQGDGWGLTTNGEHLIVSDGSDQIRFYTPDPFALVRTIKVQGGDKKWRDINELEYINGLIWANRWHTDEILAIDPNTGAVLGVADFSAIAKFFRRGIGGREKVLNGLAWSQEHQAMWVTGKHWNRRYLVKFDRVKFDWITLDSPASEQTEPPSPR